MKRKFTFLLAAILLLTAKGMTAFGQTTYEKVTSAPTDWTGEYLLVFENDATTAYCWTGVDAASCYSEFPISDNAITADDVVSLDIAAMEGGYSIQVIGGTNDGKYIYGQSGSNTIKFGDEPALNTIEYDGESVLITSFTSVMRFNNNANNYRFRYFKAASYAAQQAVQLYKKSEGDTPIEPATTIAATPEALTGFTYDVEEGGPSEIQYFELSGNDLTGNISITPSESFEISSLPGEYFRPENPVVIYTHGLTSIEGVKVYVRMKAELETGTYEEQIAVTTEGAETLNVDVAGTVTYDDPTPPTPPTDGVYVRISDLSSLTEGSQVVFAARFDGNANDYYAMTATSSGKPTGVLFTSVVSRTNEILPATITDEEDSFFWTVGVTENGYTFTNALGELVGYASGTNFQTGGDNTEWSIESGISVETAMVPNYT